MQMEKSCLEFEVFLCDENENEFLVYEKWSDKNSQKSVLNENEEWQIISDLAVIN